MNHPRVRQINLLPYETIVAKRIPAKWHGINCRVNIKFSTAVSTYEFIGCVYDLSEIMKNHGPFGILVSMLMYMKETQSNIDHLLIDIEHTMDVRYMLPADGKGKIGAVIMSIMYLDQTIDNTDAIMKEMSYIILLSALMGCKLCKSNNREYMNRTPTYDKFEIETGDEYLVLNRIVDENSYLFRVFDQLHQRKLQRQKEIEERTRTEQSLRLFLYRYAKLSGTYIDLFIQKWCLLSASDFDSKYLQVSESMGDIHRQSLKRARDGYTNGCYADVGCSTCFLVRHNFIRACETHDLQPAAPAASVSLIKPGLPFVPALIKLDLNDSDDRLKCPVCLENDKDTTLLPCHHCFCSKCVARLKACSICRAAFTSYHRIYL